ncbi:MAG: 23S rRNA (pseudouridine(1915)-N(3))-methyltransferase RlmH [Bacteroidia bacterium]
MTIKLIQIDKTSDSYLSDGISIYQKRLKNYCSFEICTINMPKVVRQKTVPEQKREEAKLILAELGSSDTLIVLDENGKKFTSRGFSELIEKHQNTSTKRLVFLIGGPFGFDQSIFERTHLKLSLSDMTFSHQMIRLFFIEQLYRAYTILKGEKYHHD